MKICNTCLESLSLEKFHSLARSKDGHAGQCRACRHTHRRNVRISLGFSVQKTFLERLWDSIALCEHPFPCYSCCWEWQGYCDPSGYGMIGITTKTWRGNHHVTRVIFEIWNGTQIKDNQLICHSCDNPPCCNPFHLWEGSYAKNYADSHEKGRHSHGEIHGHARFTIIDIRKIRELYAMGHGYGFIAHAYHVSRSTIARIVTKKTWAHVS